MAHPARTSQLENEVTSARRAATPIAKTQSAAVVALMFLSVMEELYAVRCDGDVQKCTHERPCSVHPPLRSSTSMQMTETSGTGAEEVVGHFCRPPSRVPRRPSRSRGKCARAATLRATHRVF